MTINRSGKTGLLCASSALSLLMSAGAALAQAPIADGAALEEIVVTARKQGENLIEVPVAITALTGENLTARGISSLNDLNAFVPGLRYQNSAANRNDRSFTTISIRGMYPGDSPNRQAATVFLDGIAISGGSIPGMTDIERVEVVNGPQSAYFGRSTFAGALNFVTRAPGFDTRVNASASAATYDTYEVSAGLEGAIVPDKVAARLSARHFKTGGQYRNVGYPGKLGERQTDSVAFSLYFEPMPELRIRTYATYWQDSDGASAQGVLTQADYNCAANPAAPTVLNYRCGEVAFVPKHRMSQNTAPGAPAFRMLDGRPVQEGFIDHLGLERKQSLGHVMFDYDLPGNFLLSGSAGVNDNDWAVLTDTYNRAPDAFGYSSTVVLPYDMDNYSGEIRLASDQDRALRITAGANYFSEDIFFEGRAWRPSLAVPNPAYIQLTQPLLYTARTTGLFGSLQYDFRELLTFSAEARYQWDHIGQQVMIPGGVSLEKTFGSFSPRAILSWHISPIVELYGSYAKGTRPGAFNAAMTTFTDFQRQQILARFDVPLEIPEEKLTTLEAGLKGEFFDRRLRILSAVYYGQWRGRQVNQNIPYFATPTTTSTSTATLALPGGEVNLWGLELQGALQVTQGLTLEGTFNFAETDIRNTSCTECVSVNGILNPVGNRLPRYPAYSGTLSASYERPIGGGWDGYARTDYIYTGRQYDTEANVAWTKPGQRVNLSVGARSGRYTVELFGRNIFDNKAPTNILRNTDPRTGVNTVVLAPPDRATVGARVALSY